MNDDLTTGPPPKSERETSLLKLVANYLTAEEYRFSYLDDDCIELYLQGKNLVMRMLIYFHNRHLIVRVPAFVRNTDLRRLDIFMTIMNLTNSFLDIRFEMSDDCQHLSGAINHILEDGNLTKEQFLQCMSVVAFMVDEAYPKLMKIVYGQETPPSQEKPGAGERKGASEQNDDEKKREGAPLQNPDKHNLN